MTLTVGSLFSGIGGFDLAFQREGFDVRWMCEIEPFCREVLAKKFPSVTVHRDINAVAYGRAKNRKRHGLMLEPVDVLCGGFPCQDLSVAGQRRGLAGGRSGLFFAMMRVIRLVKPTWVVIENVPGLLSSHRGADFAVVVNALVECGYGVAWRILDSQFFGVAQRRRRVFLVACAGGQHERAGAVLFEQSGRDGHPPAGEEAGPRLAACLRGRSHGPSVNMPGRGGEDDQNLVAFGWNKSASQTMRVDSDTAPALQASETSNPAIFQCHGGNVGPMGTLRKGDGGVTSGVPFIQTDRQTARSLTSTMHKHHDEDTDTLIVE